MSDYSVGVGVDVDSSELDALESRINRLDDKRIKVGVDTKELSGLLSGKNIKVKPLNIDVDTRGARKEIASLNNVAGRGMKPIELDAISFNKQMDEIERRMRDARGIGGNFARPKNLEQIKTDLAEIGRLMSAASKMDVFKNENEIAALESRIKKLRGFVDESFGAIGNSYRHAPGVGLTLEYIDSELDRIKAKQKDAFETKRIKAANDEFKNLVRLEKELGDARVGYANAKDDKELSKQMQRIKDIRHEADLARKSIVGLTGGLSGEQEKELARVQRLQNQRVQDVRDKNDRAASAAEEKAKAKETADSLRELIRLEKELGDTRIKLVNAGDEAEVKKLTKRLAELEAQAKSTESRLGRLNDKQMNDYLNSIDKQNKRVIDAQDKLVRKAEEARRKEISANDEKALKILSDNSNLGAKYKNANGVFDGIIVKSREASASIDNLRASYSYLERATNAYSNNRNETNARNLIAAEEKYQKSLKETNGYLKQNVAEEKKRTDVYKENKRLQLLENDKNSFSLRIDRWLNNNTSAVASFGDKIRALQGEIVNCDRMQLTNLKAQFEEITTEAALAGKTGLRARDNLAKKAKEYSSYFVASSLAFHGVSAVQAMARNVLEVDTAMTGLYRVTDLTSQQYSQLYDGLTVSAKEYGVTLVDLINSTADWSRAGFDANTAKGLAEVTTMYQHIADLDYKTASQNLLTAYKGFESELTSPEMFGDDTVSAVSYIGDILNELDNNYSVTAAGIGEALKRSASALDVAGNSIQETAG